jgi:hypothetical protein
MISLRELTNAELDCVSGGAEMIKRPEPIVRINPIVVVLEDILRIVEGCGGNNRTAAKKAL